MINQIGNIWARYTFSKVLLLSIVCAVFLALSGCERSVKEETGYNLPEPMAKRGCVLYRSQAAAGNSLYFVDCPNAAVTSVATTGKGAKTIFVVQEGATPDQQPAVVESVVKTIEFKGKRYTLVEDKE